MEIKLIRTEADAADASREAALQEIESLFDVPPNTPAEDRLELLTILVEVEAKHDPIPPPDPIDAILHVMDAYQLLPRDLEPYLGSLEKISEVLSRQMPLTLKMIRKLHEGLGIPAEILIRPADSLRAPQPSQVMA